MRVKKDFYKSDYDGWPTVAERIFDHDTIKISVEPKIEDGKKTDTALETAYFTSHYLYNLGGSGAYELAQFHIH